MDKLTRWKGGLKGGNRRESDMTDSYFNSGYGIKALDNIHDQVDTLEWSIAANPGDHALDTLRKEQDTIFKSKALVEDSIHTDLFVTQVIGGGLYTQTETGDGVLSNFRQSLISTARSTNDIEIGNADSGLSIIYDEDSNFNFLRVVGDIEPGPTLLGDGNDIFTSTDWSVTFDVPEPDLMFYGLRLNFFTEGVPFRLKYLTPGGKVFLETTTDREWESSSVPEGVNITQLGDTFINYATPFHLPTGVQAQIQLQFKSPVDIRGLFIRDENDDFVPGPHDGKLFFARGRALIRNVEKSDFREIITATRDSLFCYENAARHDATPHSIHSENGAIIVNEDCEYIEWFNPLGTLSTKDKLCNYEWAIRDLASPGSIHSEDYCIILTQDNEYIEWLP